LPYLSPPRAIDEPRQTKTRELRIASLKSFAETRNLRGAIGRAWPTADLSVTQRAIAQVKEIRKVIPVKDGDPIVETTLTFKLHEKKARSTVSGRASGFSASATQRAEHVDALLKAILVVLQKYLPADKIEPAIIELGGETDIAYERL
jgi:hypothetical protein